MAYPLVALPAPPTFCSNYRVAHFIWLLLLCPSTPLAIILHLASTNPGSGQTDRFSWQQDKERCRWAQDKHYQYASGINGTLNSKASFQKQKDKWSSKPEKVFGIFRHHWIKRKTHFVILSYPSQNSDIITKETKSNKWVWRRRNFYSWLEKMWSWADGMEIGMKVPWNKNGVTVWPRYSTLGVCLKDPVRETQMCASFSTTHNSQPSHQPRCLQKDKWLKLMYHKHTVEFYLARQQNEIITFAIKWINLEIIMLSELSQTQTNISLHVFLQMQNLD